MLKIQCPHCERLVTVERFGVAADPPALELKCPRCEVAWTVRPEPESEAGESPSKASDAAPAPVAAEVKNGCPKCGAPRDPARESCAECGLEFERWRGPAGPGDGETNGYEALLSQMWELVLQDFGAAERHESFLAACDGRQALPFAAARYRRHKRERPEHNDACDARLKQIVALAQISALAQGSRSKKRAADPVRKVFIAFVLVLALLILVVAVAPMALKSIRRQSRQAAGSGRSGRPPTVRNLKNDVRPRPGMTKPGRGALQKRPRAGMR